MYAKRLALGAAVVALAFSVSGALSGSSGQSTQPQPPGLAYGGIKGPDTVWLRLDPSRTVIFAFEIPWEIAPGLCKNDRNGYSSMLYAGSWWNRPIPLKNGKFSKTYVDRYRDAGIRYEEHQTVTGSVTDNRASGSLRARSIATKPNGSVARCASLTQTWSATN